MNAWIIAVGSELLTPFRVDTNSLTITDRLNAVGYEIRLKTVVGDNVDELVAVFERGIGQVNLIVVTGGLGPTADDITREALGRALNLEFDEDPVIVARLRERFARRGLTMPEINRRQAMVPRGAMVLDNVKGTAPGIWFDAKGTSIVLLPGPPREMVPMLEALIADRVPHGDGGIFRRVLRITGRTESDVDARVAPIYGAWTSAAVPISTTILAVLGQIELHLSATASSRAVGEAALTAAVDELCATLGQDVFSIDGRPLEAVVGDLLRERQWTIAVAESCSGGLLASRLTDVPGSSAYFERGAVCYSNRAKTEWADVPAALIDAHGAVSEPVAQAMAAGIRARTSAHVGIGVTGIAGPGGGTPEKPVGTVVIAVVTPDAARVRTVSLVGGRDLIKFQSAQGAMNMLRLMMLDA